MAKELRTVRSTGITRREFIGLGAGLGLAAACGPLVQSGATPSSGPVGPVGKITIARSGQPPTLDPTLDIGQREVIRSIFDTLTHIEGDGSVTPSLAESWDSNDAVTWTVKIRDGVSFHNGDPVTADDVVWTFQNIIDNKLPTLSSISGVGTIEKVGSSSVRFILKGPDAIFTRSMFLIPIMPRADYMARGAEQFGRAPIGSGPFKFVEWMKDNYVALEATGAPHFPATPTVKSIVFQQVPSPSGRVAGLETGDLDIIDSLPPPEVPRLQKASGLRVALVDSSRNVSLTMNLELKPMDDIRVRRAIDLSIDRVGLTRDLLQGLGRPTDQACAPSVFGFDPNRPLPKYDPDLAKTLVRDAGYPDGLDLTLQYAEAYFSFVDEVAQAVTGYLGKIGIRVKLEKMPNSVFTPLRRAKKMSQLNIFALTPQLMDFHTGLANAYLGTGYWSTPEFVALFQKQRATVDRGERLKILWEMTRIAGEAYSVSWLYTEKTAYGIRDRVDWTPRPDNQFETARMKLKA